MNYLFTSKRLGFRNWVETDLPKMTRINQDKEVMKYFPSTQNIEQTQQFIARMEKQFTKYGFCYFAVDKLDTRSFIGFIGISEQNYEADFTPSIDIGWRLDKESWGKGYATEGANRVLEYAFRELAIDKILSIAPVANNASENVMKKIGMRKIKIFQHPLLAEDLRLKECVLYEKINDRNF